MLVASSSSMARADLSCGAESVTVQRLVCVPSHLTAWLLSCVEVCKAAWRLSDSKCGSISSPWLGHLVAFSLNMLLISVVPWGSGRVIYHKPKIQF